MTADQVQLGSEPLSLAVTSSTGVMSVAVGTANQSCCVDVATERRHAEELTPLIGDLLRSYGAAMGDLEVLVVDVGPGRFTGLRVGLATVRALSFALKIPIVSLSSLEILARSARSTPKRSDSELVTAVIDARRQEVFQQCFVDGHPVGDAVVGRPEELSASAKGVVVGDGLDRYVDLYRAAAAAVDLRLDVHPSARAALELASGRPRVEATLVEPLYLRDPDAVANISTRAPKVSK